jgi:hypothetical protein
MTRYTEEDCHGAKVSDPPPFRPQGHDSESPRPHVCPPGSPRSKLNLSVPLWAWHLKWYVERRLAVQPGRLAPKTAILLSCNSVVTAHDITADGFAGHSHVSNGSSRRLMSCYLELPTPTRLSQFQQRQMTSGARGPVADAPHLRQLRRTLALISTARSRTLIDIDYR